MKIAQGAEAILYREGTTLIKERFAKTYRHPTIDADLRKLRTRHEAKILTKLADIGFMSPSVHSVDEENARITMDFIEGDLVKDVFNTNVLSFAAQMGEKIAQLHEQDIIHGDLTTSNMIAAQNGVHFIDFGLGYFSKKAEDKAVDLFLLDRALETTHHDLYPEIFEQMLAGYQENNPQAKEVLDRLEIVKKRGRNKKK